MDWVFRHLFDPDTLVGALALGVLFFVLAALVAWMMRAWSRRLAGHPLLFVDRTAATFISQLLQLACFLVAAIAYAYVVPALHQLGTALLASAGVVSLVIGLAAQSTLGNLIAGVALLLYRPFEIGDVLLINFPTYKETGTVKEFTLGYTKLLTDDNRWIIMPNSVVASTVIIRVK